MDWLEPLTIAVGAWSWWIATGVFLACAVWETVAPDRRDDRSPLWRWLGHFALYAGCLALTEWLPTLPDWFGSWQYRPFAAIQAYAGAGAVLLAGVAASDLLIYGVHRLDHAVFFFWRFHVVHHTDESVDLTTALRHHPIEFAANTLMTTAVGAASGLPLWVVACYGILSMSFGLLQHANIRLPSRIEPIWNLVFVGPALHRSHHANDPAYYNKNFGIVFSLWDRLFGTYRRPPTDRTHPVAFGIRDVTAAGRSGPSWVWALPLILSRGGRTVT